MRRIVHEGMLGACGMLQLAGSLSVVGVRIAGLPCVEAMGGMAKRA